MKNDINVGNHHVAILMAVYNGERFLSQQLESLKRQTHTNWSLYISDDGSTDATISIIEAFSTSTKQKVVIYPGPREGFAQNFLSLVRRKEIKAEYYAFCDQDDIWCTDRLETGLNWSVSIAECCPTVFFSRTELIDENGQHIGYSPLFHKKPSFNNALIQSIGGGNTMLFNERSRQLLAKIPQDFKVISHDWISYQIVSACGGKVNYCSDSTIFYRQHLANIIGSNKGLKNLFKRFKAMMCGELSKWNAANLKILDLYCDSITVENNNTLNNFKRLRNDSLINRIFFILKAKLYRQTILGQFGLILAIVLKKL